jgi:hypothetical protein
MLQDFISANRSELIKRCRLKAEGRSGASHVVNGVDHGVPLLLTQIAASLASDRNSPATNAQAEAASPSRSEVGATAATHGMELLKRGYSVDQVVREYGDVCQAVTQLAEEQAFPIRNEEFRTLNRCLDDAIADAVTSYGDTARSLIKAQADDLRARIASFSAEQGRLVDIASSAFVAIRSGKVGPSGATGNLLMHTLAELLHHGDHVLPAIVKLAAGEVLN